MHPTNTVFEKIILFLRLFLPMVITQFSLLAGTFVAVFLTGQYSTEHLAGMSIGFNIWITIYSGTLGILLGMVPIIAQLLGAHKNSLIPCIVQHSLYLATAFGLFLLAVGFFALDPFLSFLNLSPISNYVAQHYMLAIALCTLPLLWVCILRNLVDTHGFTHYSMFIMVSSFGLNVIASYLLIFGRFGFPELGGIGAGYATAISSWYSLIAYVIIIIKKAPFKNYPIFRNWATFDFTYWHSSLAIGVPIGTAIFAEVSIFSIATFAMSMYGTAVIAAHQAAYSLSNLFYCFPLSVSMAATIAVAYEVGAGRFQHAKQYSIIIRIIAVIIAAGLASYSFTHLHEIASLYTSDNTMIELIAHFLSYAVFFTIIDSFGTPVQGILRGYKDVKIITIIAICCYWGIGLPSAAVFSQYLGYGPYGIWLGMLTGIAIAGVLFIFRLYQQQRKYQM